MCYLSIWNKIFIHSCTILVEKTENIYLMIMSNTTTILPSTRYGYLIVIKSI